MNTAIAAVIISAVVCLLNIVAFIIARKKDSTDELTQDLTKFDGIKESLIKVNMKLDQVCATTNETRADIKSMQNQYSEMDKRIAVIERDMKTLWNKVDELREK